MSSGRSLFGKALGACVLVLLFMEGIIWAQVTASITGTVKDTSGAIIPGAKVTIKHVETGTTRAVDTDAGGNYSASSLPVGQYEVMAERDGFKEAVRQGITLVVGQQAVVNITLEVGNVQQQVTVTAEAPLVNTTLSSTSGLVGEKEVKDLPLNGRSFDQLLTLNAATANYSSNYHHTGSTFTVAGHRPETNRFMVNGMDYIGTDQSGQVPLPTGASGDLLGVDAVREFNVQQDTYGAEYGKRTGGQISIVTSSGTNNLHGELFEFLRNSVLDARNFFDFPPGLRIPPYRRNQFGGALGGPLKKDKLFLFGNYEGLRQRLGLSDLGIVPDANARIGMLPIGPNNAEILVPGLKSGMLPYLNTYWPFPNGPTLGGGVAEAFANPVQRIRDDFGLIRMDYNISASDSLSGSYLLDDGENDNPTMNNPNFIDLTPQRNQVSSIQETHIFSPSLLNVATVGFARAYVLEGSLGTVPIPSSLNFINPGNPGSFTIGGGIVGTAAGSITSAGGSGPIQAIRNLFEWADDVHYTKGNHSFSMGFWIERNQQNLSASPSASTGNVSYSSLMNALIDNPSNFIATPDPHPLGYRNTQAAWYVQDEIKLKPNLTVRLGIRDEMTSGLTEAFGRAANYLYDTNGIMVSTPLVGPSGLTQNNSIALWQPRVGVAWDPTGSGKWSVRAGFGIYNDLEDSLGIRLLADPPFNSRISFSGRPLLSLIPFARGTPSPPPCTAALELANQACYVFEASGVEPNMHFPTVQQWSFRIEREITPNLVFRIGYTGSQTYHVLSLLDMNVPIPVVCQSAAGCVSGGVGSARGLVPQGTRYLPPGTLADPYVADSQTWFFNGNSNYNALDVSVVQRFSHGLTFKANYTFSKVIDISSAVLSSSGNNEPQDVWDRYDLGLNKGPAAFNLAQVATANFSYELPFGNGRRFASGASGWRNQLVGGWQWNGIVTVQSGFPFTPTAGSNISGNGDPHASDGVDRNPGFTGPIIVGNVNEWFNPQAFSLPIPGTFGNAGRGQYVGPGLATFDTSFFKTFRVSERFRLDFRAEAFNLFNRVNFATPNPVVFASGKISGSAGKITNTATTSRQLQFALKLAF